MTDIARENLRRISRNGKLISGAMVVFSIPLIILAVVTLANGGISTGIPLLLISLPLLYFGYNLFQASRNFQEYANNPFDFVAQNRTIKGSKLKACLKKRTIGFGWAVNRFVNALTQHINKR